MVGYNAKGRAKALLDHLELYHKPKRLVRWETAAEYPADELFDDPDGSTFDPLGSYTGTAADGGEPEQDADDL